MNETLKTILNRRSIRSYKQDQIKEAELQTIIEAGKFAPSAMNQQPWHFVVVQNKEMLQKINDTCKVVFANSDNEHIKARAKAGNSSAFYNAPTFIIVFGDEKAAAPLNDGTLALGNMFLAAESLGIGSCWIHAMSFVFAAEEGNTLKQDLGVPEGYISIGAAAFGYKASDSPAPLPRKEGTVTIIK